MFMQDEKKSSNAWKTISGILAVLLLISIFTNGFGGTGIGKTSTDSQSSFKLHENEICAIDGKPIIRLFSTTWCPHCQWISETYENVVKEYGDKIVAYHWELDVGDDTLTEEIENEIPIEELSVYKEFNPSGSIPTFVFGCKHSRIGNGYEDEGNQGLIREEAEFRLIIEELLR